MKRYRTGIFDPRGGDDPLESFDALQAREKGRRRLGRYAKPRKAVMASGFSAGEPVDTAPDAPMPGPGVGTMPDPAADPALGRLVAPAIVIRDWEVPPGQIAAPTMPDAPIPPRANAPKPTADEAPTPDIGPAHAPDMSPPDPIPDRPPPEPKVIEAGTYDIYDGGTMPDARELSDDVEDIIEPRRARSQKNQQERAVAEFLSALKDAAPELQAAAPALEASPGDQIDMIADVTELSDAKRVEIAPVPKTGDTTLAAMIDPDPKATVLAKAGQARSASPAAVAEAVGLGLAVWDSTTGSMDGSRDWSAASASYVHPFTPPDSAFTEVKTDFVILAGNSPALGTEEFTFRLTIVANGYDIRSLNVAFIGDKSSTLYVSSFSVNFGAEKASLPTEAVCKIKLPFSGRWDKIGLGDYTFDGSITIAASGRHDIEFRSDLIDKDDPDDGFALGHIPLMVHSVRKLPVPIKVVQFHDVFFEKPKQSKMSDEQARLLKDHFDGLSKAHKSMIQLGRIPVTVNGFASTTGSVEDNQTLARARREGVIGFLRDQLGTEARFNGKAEGELVATGPDNEEKQDDRRVRVEITTYADP